MGIRVLVVDDSPTARGILSAFLGKDSEIEVIGTAKDGKEAIELTNQLKPDLITMDINMPVMDGLMATREIMARHPTPILVVSSLLKTDVTLAFKAIAAGALDAIEKPTFQNDLSEKLVTELIEKVKNSAKINDNHISGRAFRQRNAQDVAVVTTGPTWSEEYGYEAIKRMKRQSGNDTIVAIGASTGGPQALCKLLGQLPSDFPYGIVIVQHISQGFTAGLVEWLDKESQLTVKVAEANDQIQPGGVLVAPENYHMLVVHGERIRLNKGLPIDGHRPAVTVLFSSVADVYGKHSIGIILTGMGDDGVEGLAKIKTAGGHTIAQNEESCVVFGMPKVAIEMGVVNEVLDLDQMSRAIQLTT